MGAAATDTSRASKRGGRRLLSLAPPHAYQYWKRQFGSWFLIKFQRPKFRGSRYFRSRLNAAAGGEESFTDSLEMLRIKAGAQAIP